MPYHKTDFHPSSCKEMNKNISVVHGILSYLVITDVEREIHYVQDILDFAYNVPRLKGVSLFFWYKIILPLTSLQVVPVILTY